MSNQLAVAIVGKPSLPEHLKNFELELYALCDYLEVIRRALCLVSLDDGSLEGEAALIAELQQRIKAMAARAEEAGFMCPSEQP